MLHQQLCRHKARLQQPRQLDIARQDQARQNHRFPLGTLDRLFVLLTLQQPLQHPSQPRRSIGQIFDQQRPTVRSAQLANRALSVGVLGIDANEGAGSPRGRGVDVTTDVLSTRAALAFHKQRCLDQGGLLDLLAQAQRRRLLPHESNTDRQTRRLHATAAFATGPSSVPDEAGASSAPATRLPAVAASATRSRGRPLDSAAK
jgi:hypothetical protein